MFENHRFKYNHTKKKRWDIQKEKIDHQYVHITLSKGKNTSNVIAKASNEKKMKKNINHQKMLVDSV